MSSDWPTKADRGGGEKSTNRMIRRRRRKTLVQLTSDWFLSAPVTTPPLLLLLPLLMAHVLPIACAFSCPNECSKKGTCEPTSGGALTQDGSAGICSCFAGFHGIDCSQRMCPTGRALFDAATADSTAHRIGVECSGAGTCDTNTGTCVCLAEGDDAGAFRFYEGAIRMTFALSWWLFLFSVRVAFST